MGIANSFNLKGKKAFITGGAKGIGKSIGICFAQAGADVAILDIDNKKAEEAADELRKFGTEIIAIRVDTTKPEEVNEMIKKVLKNFGTIDIAFNNAGICITENAEDMSYESWQKVININLTGVFLTAQAAGRIMINNKKGSIINTASMSGHVVNYPQGQCAYNASKAGVILLTKSLAAEWAKYNVRVNSISPGYVVTEMTMSDKDWIPIWKEHTPMKRLGNPEELQGTVLYLASDASTYTTGTDIIIDGGYTCW